MSIEKAKRPLGVALEGLLEMREHLMAAYESFDASSIAAERTHTGLGGLVAKEFQEANDSFTRATGIIRMTTLRELYAAQKHMMESGIRNTAGDNAYMATTALDATSDNFKEFVNQVNVVGSTLENITGPLVNKATEANRIALEAASRPIEGTDRLPELVRRIDIDIMVIENFGERL